MGRGNVYVTGSYEGLFYIDNDDLQVWRKDGPDENALCWATAALSLPA